MSKYIIVIDTETTGFSIEKGSEITEIGAIKVDSKTLEIVDEWETLIDIDGPVPHFITNLTGITKDMLDAKGIAAEEAFTILKEFCGDATMFAHYAPFDRKVVRGTLDKLEMEYIETPWNDTINIFKQAWPGRKSYKLEGLIKDHNLADKEDHRALSDARHTLTLMKMAKEKGVY